MLSMSNNEYFSTFGIFPQYMSRCLELAQKGKGYVAPNPMVGAVIVYKGKIIGEGYHRKYGDFHAEVNAIRSVKNQELLKKATLYVNLEPCCHTGKTPPCTDLIIEKQISQVVVGQIDPFPQVAGKGIKTLQDAGIEVIIDLLKEECENLNKRFLTFTVQKRPYIVLKWAQSSDGYIDTIRQTGDGQKPVRFSDNFTQILVHKMRAEEAAITVGSRTIALDNPKLDVRYWHGNNPIKIKIDSGQSLSEQMRKLHTQGIQSLIVEGGAKLLQSYINSGLWDEAKIEISDFKLFGGIKAPVISGYPTNVQKCKKTSILVYKN
jgi:diaminohydroxyphosphoribosylaminopyrimidine deaminase/5-amino-6-(5-phosphoribosylamino)uracil reductase